MNRKWTGCSSFLSINPLNSTLFTHRKRGRAIQKLAGVNPNKLLAADRAAHDWYRFVLSFPPHLVRNTLTRFGITETQRVLDPFCGTGTTIVECKKLGVPCVGIEANPMARFASQVKVDWNPDPEGLVRHAHRVAEEALGRLAADGIHDDDFHTNDPSATYDLISLPVAQEKLLLKDSISPLPLHKTLILLDCINQCRHEAYYDHERLALAKALIRAVSNLHFGPEVGVGPPKWDSLVVPSWLDCVHVMAADLRELRSLSRSSPVVHQGDARQVGDLLAPESIDAVITSPPYPNEKDYTRTTRLESVILGMIQNKSDLRSLKEGLVRSNTRNVFVRDDDDAWVADQQEVQRIAQEIEARRVELGKTSGFERMYPRATTLYFGGMARHLAGLRSVLRPGARLAYVVGDQASYLRVMIRTGRILADIATSLGYGIASIDLFRTRLATATQEQLREEVVVLSWSGGGGSVARDSVPGLCMSEDAIHHDINQQRKDA